LDELFEMYDDARTCRL